MAPTAPGPRGRAGRAWGGPRSQSLGRAKGQQPRVRASRAGLASWACDPASLLSLLTTFEGALQCWSRLPRAPAGRLWSPCIRLVGASRLALQELMFVLLPIRCLPPASWNRTLCMCRSVFSQSSRTFCASLFPLWSQTCRISFPELRSLPPQCRETAVLSLPPCLSPPPCLSLCLPLCCVTGRSFVQPGLTLVLL